MPKADLAKRPAKPKNVDMDMSGTFKKLDIDWAVEDFYLFYVFWLQK